MYSDYLYLLFCTDSNLTMGDISFIYDKLYETRTKWAEIGMRLGVDHETLSSIKTMNFHDHEKCLRAMIADRLKTGRKLTWKDICNCLRHQTVARNDTAEKIESQLKGMYFLALNSSCKSMYIFQ